MNTNANTISEPKGLEVNVLFLVKTVLARWWILLTSTVLCAALGWGISMMTTDPTYTTNLSFTTYNKAAADVVSSSDINSSIMMTNTFKYILEGRPMRETVAKSCSFNVSAEQLSRYVSVNTQADTNIIIVSVTTDSPEKSYEIASGIAKHYQDIVDYAYPNATLQIYEKPFKPTSHDPQLSLMRFAAIGGVIGFALSFILILVFNATRDTVQSSNDIQMKLDSKLLGSISTVRTKSSKKVGRQALLITDRSLGFSFIESYKAIRTRVETLCTRKNYKTILVTSAGAGEGKTTFSLNLALSLSQNGRSVLLIDADMRKPTLYRFLNLNIPRGNDLASVISGKTDLSDAIKYVEKYKLFILSSIEPNSEPTEILSSQQMNKIVKAARKEFDFVIIDTAPAAVVTDATILSNFADACIMVVRENFSDVARIRSVISDLESYRAELIGCVYNNTARDGFLGRYSKYHYGYYYNSYKGNGGYGYGYGYEDEESAAEQ